MPLSNKRTTSLPNPSPVGLQSHCSIMPALHPLGCTRPQHSTRPIHGGIPAPQPHQPPAPKPTPCWNTCPWPSNQIHNHWDPHDQSTPDLSPEPVTQLAGTADPSPTPTTLQALLSPNYVWDDRTPPLGLSPPIRTCWAPDPCGMTGAPLLWDRHQPGMR
jgi:hypothetical protein